LKKNATPTERVMCLVPSDRAAVGGFEYPIETLKDVGLACVVLSEQHREWTCFELQTRKEEPDKPHAG
jgi:hypothetical protein